MILRCITSAIKFCFGHVRIPEKESIGFMVLQLVLFAHCTEHLLAFEVTGLFCRDLYATCRV